MSELLKIFQERIEFYGGVLNLRDEIIIENDRLFGYEECEKAKNRHACRNYYIKNYKRRTWSQFELGILRTTLHLTPRTIQPMLKDRTIYSIREKRTRLRKEAQLLCA